VTPEPGITGSAREVPAVSCPVFAPPCRLARIVCVGVELIELTVKDRAAWRRWLEKNHSASPGVWLTLAKKAKPGPTTLTYDEALEESLCFG
jgi:hypothetical protein